MCIRYRFIGAERHGRSGDVLAVNIAALNVPACRIGGRAHGNGQVRRDIEQPDFAEQAVDAACWADDLVPVSYTHLDVYTRQADDRFHR